MKNLIGDLLKENSNEELRAKNYKNIAAIENFLSGYNLSGYNLITRLEAKEDKSKTGVAYFVMTTFE